MPNCIPSLYLRHSKGRYHHRAKTGRGLAQESPLLTSESAMQTGLAQKSGSAERET